MPNKIDSVEHLLMTKGKTYGLSALEILDKLLAKCYIGVTLTEATRLGM